MALGFFAAIQTKLVAEIEKLIASGNELSEKMVAEADSLETIISDKKFSEVMKPGQPSTLSPDQLKMLSALKSQALQQDDLLTQMMQKTQAMVRISSDGRTASFDPAKDFVHFPGGSKKFTIRFDPASKRYWSLSNYIPPKFTGPNPAGTRNTLALIRSADLRNWEVRAVVLQHPDRAAHAFQYVDWQFDGADLVVASRTAFDDGLGGAHSGHDANFMTFHRVENFRNLTRAED